MIGSKRNSNIIIQLLRSIKNILYYILGIFYYKINKINVNILSIDETIKLAKDKSVVRFGDGEIALINGIDIVYQTHNVDLSKKLMAILNQKEPNILVCLPDIFGNMDPYNFKDRYFHIKFLFYYRKFFFQNVDGNKYGNTFMSRPYIIFKNKKNSIDWFSKLMEVWDDKEIVIVEGSKSKTGVGNTLFKNAKLVERVLCPSKNAFDKYNEITNELLKMERNKLYLFALGPTAKIIIYELTKHGYHAIDIGHLDSEYEWSIRGAKSKIRIEGKHTAEFKDDYIEQGIEDEEYNRQIVYHIA